MKNLKQKLRLAINNIASSSKIETLSWRGHPLFIKRDDLLDPYLSGNKLRKLYYFLQTDVNGYKQIVSYGGMQSNAMLSIARLAQLLKLPFTYYVRYKTKIDETIQSNYSLATGLGMRLEVLPAISDDSLSEKIKTLCDRNTLLIPQGGASVEAKVGIELLAKEIMLWKREEQIKELVVATPSGTGTTALWLQEVLGADIKVLTTAVVGDSEYLKKQMQRLSPKAKLPLILETKKNYAFAKPDSELFPIYLEFLQLGVEVDLIYAPVMLKALDENRDLWKNKTLLYIHSGGVPGNTSQKARYEKLV